MHSDWLADDEAISNELSDGLTGVGIGDLAGLIGVEPNLALSAAYDGGRQTLLGGEIDHDAGIVDGRWSMSGVVEVEEE